MLSSQQKKAKRTRIFDCSFTVETGFCPRLKPDSIYGTPLGTRFKTIEQTKDNGETVLDLSCNALSSLPPEIGKLANLKVLELSCDEFISLPPEIIDKGPQTVLAYFMEQLKESKSKQ